MMCGKLSGPDDGKQYNGSDIAYPENIQKKQGHHATRPKNRGHDLRDSDF
jgi:hypothetical protein